MILRTDSAILSAQHWGYTEKQAHLLTLNATSGALSRKAVHCPDKRKQTTKNAWAMFSGSTNWNTVSASSDTENASCAYLVELVAKVYGVNIVAFQVGEHDNLYSDVSTWQWIGNDSDGGAVDAGCLDSAGFGGFDSARTKKTMVKSRPAAINTANRNNHPR